MKQNEVQVGQVYAVKVGDRLAPVQLVSESPYGGWYARNLRTGRNVRIRSAQKCRFRVVKNGAGKWARA